MASADDKLLDEAREVFADIVDAESSDRERYKRAQEFAAGAQWDEAIRRAREADPFGARPCLTFDKVGQYRKQIVNDARQNKPSIKVIPAGESADGEVAEILSDVVRYIERSSRADIAYDWALESAVTAGIGWFRLLTEVIDEERNEQDIRIARIPNVFSVYPEVGWQEPDGSDIMRLFVTDEMPRKKFEARYPKADLVSWERDHRGSQHWVTQEFVRIAEYYRVLEVKKNELYFDDGTALTEEEYWKLWEGVDGRPQPMGTRSRKRRTVEWAKMTCAEVLDQTIIPGDYIPVIPVIGNEDYVDGKRILSGIVDKVMDPQRAYNYARTAYIETVALAPKSPYIVEVDQTEEFPEWEDANVRNYSRLRYRNVDGAPPPQRQSPVTPPTGWLTDMQIAEHDIQAALGMYSASIGKNDVQKSGRALLAEQQEGDTATFHFVDNLSRSVRHAGNIIVSWIPKVYDTRRVMQIIGEDDTQQQAVLNPQLPAALAKVPDDAGNITRVFNPNVGKYGVTVAVGPSYNSKRQEAAASMMEMMRGNAPLMQIAGDLMVKAMDWPMADDLAKRLKAAVPPQILQASEAEGDDQRVQQAVQMVQQQAQMQMQQLMQALEQMQAQNQQAMQENEALKAQLQNKAMDVQIKGVEMQQSAELKQAEFQIKNRELDLKEREQLIQAAQIEAQQMQAAMPQTAEGEEPGEPKENEAVMAQLAAMMEGMQAITQTLAVLAAPKRKRVSITTPSGGVYEGQSDGGVLTIRAPSGGIYQGNVEED